MIPLSEIVDATRALVTTVDQRWVVDPEDFLRVVEEPDGRALATRLFRMAADEKSEEAICAAMAVVSAFGISDTAVDPLLELAEQSWHDFHEEIAFELGILKDDKAVPLLMRWLVELPEPFEEGDGNGIHSKAAHALVTIGSSDSLQALAIVRRASSSVEELVESVIVSRGIELHGSS